MKIGLHLTPGSETSRRAALSAGRRLTITALVIFLILLLLSIRVGLEARSLSSKNESFSERIGTAKAEKVKILTDPVWKPLRDEVELLGKGLDAAGPGATSTLFELESALPREVVLSSVAFSRKNGTIVLEGRSPRYEGGDQLRSALEKPGGGWRFAVERNGYDQKSAVYTFRLAGKWGGR